MAAMLLGIPVHLPELHVKCSFRHSKRLKYKNDNLLLYENYAFQIIINFDFNFQLCKLSSDSKNKATQKVSTVAAYANELDSAAANETNNFEYDDNEWDIRIGHLIVNLDADIEKTQNEKLNSNIVMASTPAKSSINHQIQNSENSSSSCNDKTSYLNSGQLPSSTTLSSPSCINTQNLNNIVNTVNNPPLLSSGCKINSSNIISNTEIENSNKMTVEHSATVDKGLKMKIKRTKPGSKSIEAKHEIVKSNELNGSLSKSDVHVISNNSVPNALLNTTVSQSTSNTVDTSSTSNKLKSTHSSNIIADGFNMTNFTSSKRASNSHRREKSRDKHDKLQANHATQSSKLELSGSAKQISHNQPSPTSLQVSSGTTTPTVLGASASNSSNSTNDQITSSNTFTNMTSVTSSLSTTISAGNDISQSATITTSSTLQQVKGSLLCSKSVFQINQSDITTNDVSNYDAKYSLNTSLKLCSSNDLDLTKCSSSIGNIHSVMEDDLLDTTNNSPPTKKLKSLSESDLKEMSDACVGTSIGTVTEPDCLGPCEPGTSVTLEGIVWHETEGGVLVVNITWRGKTYVGTLLDCTRHDWAPPRFCDSPTSDLDARIPKGRSKRGRATTNLTNSNDLSNFTETRSSVHSKLRNNGIKGRRGVHGSPVSSPSSAAFVSPRTDSISKRKTRCIEDEEKNKRKIPPPTPPSISPSTSPVLLECPEPNCSKKYKHINGLKYHQSHAHGTIYDDDTKDLVTSLSENDESNIEVPSPTTSVKSPLNKTENTPNVLISPVTNLLEPLSSESSMILHVALPEEDSKSSVISDTNIIKSTILRFVNDNQVPNSSSLPSITSQINKKAINKLNDSESPSFLSTHSSISNDSPSLNENVSKESYTANTSIISHVQNPEENSTFQPNLLHIQQPRVQHSSNIVVSPQPINCLVQKQENRSIQNQSSHNTEDHEVTDLEIAEQQNSLHNLSNQTSSQNSKINDTISSTIVPIQDIPSHYQSFTNIGLHNKVPQFKVKPTAALMPEQNKNKDLKLSKTSSLKKRSRKSPSNSPLASVIDTGREDVQSPAYSDISDDATPSDEIDTCDKLLKPNQEKEIKNSTQDHLTTHFSMYPYYGQPSYLIQNIQDKSPNDSKISETNVKNDLKSLNIVSIPTLNNLQNENLEKEKKESITSQMPPQSQGHYYTNFNSYLSAGYPFQVSTENSSSLNQLPETEFYGQKSKIKQELQNENSKEKHLENHQILKENTDIKSQLNPYQLYQNSQNQRPSPTPGIVLDDRRYFIYSGDHRHKDELQKQNISQKLLPPSPKQLKQDKLQDINKNDETKIKNEGVKPTMETQGPPPPPTSQYAYIHPGYIPAHHYGSISYDPGSGMYRNLTPMIVSGAYSGNHYLHQLPRYHAPEDLSRSPNGKTLDLLHHANQYYSSHKIHELQERALKSPTSKTLTVSSSPLSTTPSVSIRSPNSSSNNSSGSSSSIQTPTTNNKHYNQNTGQQQQHQSCSDPNSASLNKDNRSPPPQRHVHTHHHTHVGLGYPILPGQYPAPYGAAVLASQQAAAVAATVISPFTPK